MKKILSLILVFILAFCTIGCGNSGGNSTLQTGGGENGSLDFGSTGGVESGGDLSGSNSDTGTGGSGGVEDGGGATEGGSTGGGSSSSESEIVNKGELLLTDGVYKITEAKSTDAAGITVDFGDRKGSQVQNTKKIDMFSPTWNFGYSEGLNQESLKSLQYIQQFKAEAFRFDMMMGGIGGIADTGEYDPSTNTATYINGGDIYSDASWAKINGFADALNEYNIIPYFVMIGIPKFAQNGNDPRAFPQDKYFTEFAQVATKYFKDKGRRIIYETWNEPDLNDFEYWTSGMARFTEFNCKATSYFKKGDPDAYVAEGGLCWPLTTYASHWNSFINYTNQYQNHVDALSWHFYGDQYGDLNYGAAAGGVNIGTLDDYCTKIRNYMNNTSNYDFRTTTMHITEFAAASTRGNGYANQSQVSWLPKLFNTIDKLKSESDVTRVSWACWMLHEFSIIDPYLFLKYPVYYALWSNGRLPLAPATYTNSDTTNFGVNTGVDAHRAAAVIYNKNLNTSTPNANAAYGYASTNKNKNVTVLLKNIPFTAKNVKIYLVDTQHVSYNTADDKPYLIMDLPETQVKQEMKFNFTIPENAAFHIEVSDGTTDANGELICETDIESNLYEHIVRKDYYYDTHADNIPNADIFEAAMKVSLSMSSYNDGQAALMLTLKDMNKFTNLELDYDVWDLPAKRSDRGLGVRVDYHTESGYTSQKYYYYDDYSNCFYYNYNKANANGYTWGNGQDITSGGVSIGSGTNGTFTIPLKANAPSGWDGRVQLTYFMINGGQNANAIFTTRGV